MDITLKRARNRLTGKFVFVAQCVYCERLAIQFEKDGPVCDSHKESFLDILFGDSSDIELLDVSVVEESCVSIEQKPLLV